MQDLQVMKVEESSGSKCFVLTLNHSVSALPEAALEASARVLTRLLMLVVIQDNIPKLLFVCTLDNSPVTVEVTIRESLAYRIRSAGVVLWCLDPYA